MYFEINLDDGNDVSVISPFLHWAAGSGVGSSSGGSGIATSHLSVGSAGSLKPRELRGTKEGWGLGACHPTRPRKERNAMTEHTIGTREEWLAARLELLEAEKELPRRSDELARRRQELPRVRVDKEYRFETDEGSASLADLFAGRSQLSSTTFMFGPTTRRGVRPPRRPRTGSTATSSILRSMTSRFRRCRGRRLSSSRRTSGGCGGRFPQASSRSSHFNVDFATPSSHGPAHARPIALHRVSVFGTDDRSRLAPPSTLDHESASPGPVLRDL